MYHFPEKIITIQPKLVCVLMAQTFYGTKTFQKSKGLVKADQK